MRRFALVLAVAAMAAVAGCSASVAPSSDVTATLLPSASAQAAAASAGPSAASGPASPAVAPSESPSAPPSATPKPTPKPSPTPRPTPVPTPVCTSTMLTAKVTGWEGAMGSQLATVKLTNASAATCKLRGTPRLQLVDAGGHILIDSKTLGAAGLPHVSPGDKTWLLAHNGWVTTMVQVTNYCGATTPVLPTTIAFYLPSNGGRLVAAAGPGGSTPPCNGRPGDAGSIAMNGWAH
jgi:hypothetical protein